MAHTALTPQPEKGDLSAFSDLDTQINDILDDMGIGVVIQNRDGLIISANHSACLILGFSGDALMGMTSDDADWRATNSNGVPLDGPDHPPMIALQTGKPVTGFIMGLWNTSLQERVWLSVNAKLLRDPDTQEIRGVASTFTDVTALTLARNQLKASEERWHSILHHSPVGLCIVEFDGRLAEVNKALCDLLGYSINELSGMYYQDLIFAEDLVEDTYWANKLREGELAFHERERRYRSKDGSAIWVLQTGALLRNNTGGPDQYLAQIQSINERKQNDDRATIMAQRLALAADSARLGIWDWNLLTNENVWNDRMFEIFNVAPTPDKSAPKHWLASFLPEDRAHVAETIQKVFDSKDLVSFEGRIKWSDGSIRHIEGRQDIILDSNGASVRVVGVAIDVTETKEAQATIEAARFRLRSLIDALPMWISTIDRDGRYIIANKRYAETFNRPLSQIEGHHYTKVMSAESIPDRAAIFKRCLAGEEVLFPARIAGQDGKVFYCEGRCVPLRRHGEITGIIQAIWDVTDLKNAEQELAHANRDLTRRMTEISALQLKLQELSNHDPLTGLVNRRLLDEALPREMARCKRSGEALCVAMADLDRFKLFNDSYGHLAGDEALRMIGQIITRSLRRSDLICRYGGEEILIVMPSTTEKSAHLLIERLRQEIEIMPIKVGDQRAYVTISFGITSLKPEDATMDALIGRADKALYVAKGTGRNKTICFSELEGKDLA